MSYIIIYLGVMECRVCSLEVHNQVVETILPLLRTLYPGMILKKIINNSVISMGYFQNHFHF